MEKEIIPSNLKYTKEHEWARIDNDIATIGITHHAQHQLGDVVYLELPERNVALIKDKTFGVVESVKAVSDLFAPLSGDVIDVNTALVNIPETINRDPYGDAWMIKIRITHPNEVAELMNVEGYTQYLKDHTK